MKEQRRRDRIFEASFVDDLPSITTQELRERRGICEEVEAELSFTRRLLQGKLDILRHELERRAAGGAGGMESILERLPDILSDPDLPHNGGRHTRIIAPANADKQRRDVERLVSEGTLASVDELSTEDLSEMVERLALAEKEASETRRRVQNVMDAVHGELVRRYKEGQEDPSILLRS